MQSTTTCMLKKHLSAWIQPEQVEATNGQRAVLECNFEDVTVSHGKTLLKGLRSLQADLAKTEVNAGHSRVLFQSLCKGLQDDLC